MDTFNKKMLIWFYGMLVFAFIYFMYMVGIVEDLYNPTFAGRSIYNTSLATWGTFGFLGIILHETIKG